MRKLIAAMKITLDGMAEGPDGLPDWVGAWSEDYGLTPRIDACVLGGGMYPGYERYWTSVRGQPDRPAWITGAAPTAAERAWADFAADTPHYVLSRTLETAAWPSARIVRDLAAVAALKRQPGKDIYLVGGARTTASFMEAGLVDELRLIVYPLLAGPGKPLFAVAARRGLALREVEQLGDGRIGLTYALAA